MKIIVCAPPLRVSGTTVNAIELAAALRDIHGHEVVYFATPGPMIGHVQEKKLRMVPAPAPRLHPSPAKMKTLCSLIRRERPDLIYAWDWARCLDAYYIAHLAMRIPMVVTDMCMILQRVLPKALPTTFGTPKIVDLAKAAGRKRVELLFPPVDVVLNAPGSADPKALRQRFGIKASDITLVTVSRLDTYMKGESLRRTIEAVRALGASLPVGMIVVGDGDARPDLEQLGRQVNAELGRKAVNFTGTLVDPRPAYAAADIVVGMGGSALRGMAFAKPVIVVGELGFAAPFNSQTAEFFYYNGIYGVGESNVGNANLVGSIRAVAEHSDRLPALGEFSRQFVEKHFALETVCARLERFCRVASTEARSLHVAMADGLRTAGLCLRERRFIAGP